MDSYHHYGGGNVNAQCHQCRASEYGLVSCGDCRKYLCPPCCNHLQCHLCLKTEMYFPPLCEECTLRCERCAGLVLCHFHKAEHVASCNPKLFIQQSLVCLDDEILEIKGHIRSLQLQLLELNDDLTAAGDHKEELERELLSIESRE
jgi:hypothetical protein